MEALARFVSGRVTAWIVLALGAGLIGALFVLLPAAGQAPPPASGLPASSEARQVSRLLEDFPGADRTAAVLVFHRDSGLTEADRAAITGRAQVLAGRAAAPQAVRPRFSDAGDAALVLVPLEAAAVDADVDGVAERLRAQARAGLPDGLTAQLTGPVGFRADITNAFAGTDVTLLAVTALVVAVLLIVTYRSPLLWIVPLAVVGAADGLARLVVAALADRFDIAVDASTFGIQSVLVFGAGTNYAMLLIARYREELVRNADRHDAMRIAVRSAGPTIAASGGTVALSLLTLLFAELAGSRALGFACALGVVVAILVAVLLLPAALAVFGRGLFWPFVPRHDPAAADTTRGGVWQRIGRGVARRPRTVVAVCLVVLAVASLGLTGIRSGLSQTEQLLGDPESVRAQRVLDRAFPAGVSSQTIVLAPASAADQAASIARSVAGVAAVRTGPTANERTELDLTLGGAPGTAAAFTTIRALRDAYERAPGPVGSTLVGGTDATALDERDAMRRDQRIVIPAILVVVLLILTVLLRSLVAPVLLLVSVLATYAASLGLGNLLFRNVFGFPAFDTPVPLYSFLFLVALGVDYNIFLTARAREERARRGTREGMIVALGATGGVITSAGVLLAAVFVVLGVLPVVALAQNGTLVCIGVLIDTLLVRTLLVPALAFLTGDTFWWPSRRPQTPAPAGSPPVAALDPA
ncbi:membrane protein [Couchioplanes caeruleus subsp. azureus]|nr:membrane protein [Couchioplanes caeruleus subsp. azureus]